MLQCHSSTLSSNYNCVVKGINTHFISLNSQKKNVSYNINHTIMDEDTIEFECQDYENRLFQI